MLHLGSRDHPCRLLEKVNDKLKDVTQRLTVQAEQLNAHEKYRDAEYIYTRIFSLSESVRRDDLTIELSSKLLLLYEKTDNQSAVESIQEFLVRAVNDGEIDEDAFNWVTEKVCQNYMNFHDRVKTILLESGEEESFSAEFARMAAFYRIATLDIYALSRAVTGSQWMLVPKMALHVAAQVGSFSLTSILIEEDDHDINLKDERGTTALHLVVQKGPCQLLQVFLDAHADLEITNDVGDTALLLAARSTSESGPEIVKRLLDAGANARVSNIWGSTSLHLAARFGTPETVEILLDHDVQVNARDKFGQTPLLGAFDNFPSRDVAIVRQLLHAGAYLKVPSTNSVGSLMRAAHLGNAAMLKFLLSYKEQQGFYAIQDMADRSMALHAALKGPLATQGACISTLLKAGVAIETKHKGMTALGMAVWLGRLAAARQLLKYGADVETEIEGERLLCYSVGRGDESATRLLLEKGADARQENHKGESPLSVAIAGSREAIVLMLLAADFRCRASSDRKGNTTFHQAIIQDHEEHGGILNVLLGHATWPYPNEKNFDGYTPLQLAVSLKRFKLAKTLLAQQFNNVYYTSYTVMDAATQDIGSLLSLTTSHSGDPCFEALEELKLFWRTLTSQPPINV